MIMNRYQAEADEFVRQYASRPNRRKALVEGLVRAGGRLQLNMPRYGIARLISERLRSGPFSVFYEFEKSLARTLHPLLADLNLNLCSDILVNRVFGVKYGRYARAVNRALAAGAGVTIDTLRDVILAMVEEDGHYMVVKFYDLVLRGANPGLFKKARPAELSIIEMKNGAGEAAPDRARVHSLYKQFGVHYGIEAAELLRRRMEWDPALRDLVPGAERPVHEPEGAEPHVPEGAGGSGADGPEQEAAAPAGVAPETESDTLGYDPDIEEEEGGPSSPWDSMIAKYAVVIKRDFLDGTEDGDGDGMRQIVGAMFRKNARAFGNEEADEIVCRVLEAWIADRSVGEQRRGLLRGILDERQGAGGAGETPVEYGESSADETEETAATGEDAILEAEPGPGMGTESIESGVTDAEMDALTRELEAGAIADPGHDDESAAGDAGAAPASGKDADHGFDAIALDMDGPAEEFLLSDTEASGKPGSDGGEGFLIEDLDVSAAPAPSASPGDQQDGDFIVQDEILFEDKSLRKKQGGRGQKDDA